MSTHSAELTSTDQQTLERERVLDQFRRWGYMDANLNPFGGPIAGGYPDVRLEGPAAAIESRRAGRDRLSGWRITNPWIGRGVNLRYNGASR